MISYLDTSAAMKLLVEEAETSALTTYLQSPDEDLEVVASALLVAVGDGWGAHR